MLKNILALDPSTTIAGWAFGSAKGLIECGLVKGDPKAPPIDRAIAMGEEIAKKVQMRHLMVHDFIMEEPCNWQSQRGMASSNSGALTQLSIGAGAMYSTLRAMLLPFVCSTVTPQKWKGQLPKELFFRRIAVKYQLDLKYTLANCNITDAVGLLEWYLKNRTQERPR